ncbi:MAG TPA: winged helix-turn-helix transcriptional regulator, partial [Acidimicrobiia bacterium]|nr:winged helix-turn-helix transcriptional regulator [Acidimicrobiia bacterium]
QYCALAHALDVIGGRWSMLIVRDLLTGPKRFKDLQDGLTGIPTNVLSARLKELEEAGVVRRQLLPRPAKGVGYELTEFGRELEEPLVKLGGWGAKSLGPAAEGEPISVDGLALGLRGAFRPDAAAGLTRTYELTLDGRPLRISVNDGQLAITAETNGADLGLATTPALLVGLLFGHVGVDDAIAAGQLTVTGSKTEARRFFRIFQFDSPAAP